VGQEAGGDLQDDIALGEMAAEMAVDGCALGSGKAAAALPPGDRRCHLHGGDPGDVERVARLGSGLGAHPMAADLVHMPFDQGTRVEEERRHPQRRSRMMVSDSGSPLMVMSWSSGSSKSAAVSGSREMRPSARSF